MIRDRIIKINDMIRKIKDKQLLKEVFNISLHDLQSNGDNKYSVNDNGIFFDLKLLSDTTLEKIEELLKQNISTETDSLTFSMHCSDDNDIVDGNIVIKKK